jgi:ribosomal protein S12 methylthiotransferase accessory factor YcaO
MSFSRTLANTIEALSGLAEDVVPAVTIARAVVDVAQTMVKKDADGDGDGSRNNNHSAADNDRLNGIEKAKTKEMKRMIENLSLDAISVFEKVNLIIFIIVPNF